MNQNKNNFAYIDGANLYKGIVEKGWRLDYKRFRVWLTEKYAVTRAYLFLGFIPTNANLYRDLQNWGYTIVFKPTIPDGEGEIKGNCDAEMVLQAISDMYENFFKKAVLVTGDGDFACLARFLEKRDRLVVVLSPNVQKASVLLKKAIPHKIIFLERFKNRLERIPMSNKK